MPTKRRPVRPDLAHLKHQTKDLLSDHRAATIDACQRIREFHPRFSGATDNMIASAKFTLADAYLTVAREDGFPSWARLRTHVVDPARDPLDRPHHERIQDVAFRRAVDLLDDGDVEGLCDHLRRHPGIVHQQVIFEGGNYFREPTLLEFVAENPGRHDSLPPNIVEVARSILDAGARTNQTNLRTDQVQQDVIRLVGPGGAGKTTTGPRLAQRLGVTFVDLDERFAATHGDISEYLDVHGYIPYAMQNVQNYLEVIGAAAGPYVLALSSGFMTYATGVHPGYAHARGEIAASATTLVLLPSLDYETCVAETVRRQLGRPFRRSAEREEVIRQRFGIYRNLSATKLETMKPVSEVVDAAVANLLPNIACSRRRPA